MPDNSEPAAQNGFSQGGEVSEAKPARPPVFDLIRLEPARTADEIAAIRELFQEYAQSLGFNLCFQSFDTELASLPGDYAPPDGRLLLLTVEGIPAGCVALHGISPGVSEMKRLYLRPQFRGRGLGKLLTESIISEARQIGYERIRLDTVEPMMRAAVSIYRNLGFQEIPPYRPNPIAGALYLELALGKEKR